MKTRENNIPNTFGNMDAEKDRRYTSNIRKDMDSGVRCFDQAKLASDIHCNEIRQNNGGRRNCRARG